MQKFGGVRVLPLLPASMKAKRQQEEKEGKVVDMEMDKVVDKDVDEEEKHKDNLVPRVDSEEADWKSFTDAVSFFNGTGVSGEIGKPASAAKVQTVSMTISCRLPSTCTFSCPPVIQGGAIDLAEKHYDIIITFQLKKTPRVSFLFLTFA